MKPKLIKLRIIFLLVIGVTELHAQSNPVFIDSRDGNEYKALTIGTQVWMAENLKYLPSVFGPATDTSTTSYYYVYGYNGTNVKKAKAKGNYSTYGALYNWQAAKEACPASWHLPSDAEWTILTDYLGGESDAGDKLKQSEITDWTSSNTTGSPNRAFFTALAGGFRDDYDGTFNGIGQYAYWWSASEDSIGDAWFRSIDYNFSDLNRVAFCVDYGLSVRCVKD